MQRCLWLAAGGFLGLVCLAALAAWPSSYAKLMACVFYGGGWGGVLASAAGSLLVIGGLDPLITWIRPAIYIEPATSLAQAIAVANAHRLAGFALWRFPSGGGVAAPCWAVASTTGLLTWLCLRRWRRLRRRARPGQCPGCGYDLRASAGDCPECGAAQPVEAG